MKRILFYSTLLIGIVFLFSCTSDSPQAKVGDYPILRSMVQCRDRIIKLQYPNETRSMGLHQLIEAYQQAQILKNNKDEITPEQIRAEKERIDRETLMPDVLKKFKDACGGDGEVFQKAYVLPTLAGRRLPYEFFPNAVAIHQESINLAQEILKKALSSSIEFPKWLKSQNVKSTVFEVSEIDGILGPERGRGMPPASLSGFAPTEVLEAVNTKNIPEAKVWIETIFSKLKPKQIYPEVINQQDALAIIYYLGTDKKRPNVHLAEIISIPKKSFTPWYESELKKIPVQYP